MLFSKLEWLGDFICPEGLGDFFVSREVGDFLVLIFLLSR